MIQTYSMIFWARPYKMSADEMADISYQILKELNDYGDELSPKYIPGRKKSEAKEFDLSRENVKQLLDENVDTEGYAVFEEPGRSLGFFSSYKEELSSGIRINIGISSSRFNNTLVVNLPYGGFSGFDVRRDDFEKLFKKIVTIFNPYFAFVSNNLNEQLSDLFWENDRPTFVHWLNYYSASTAKKIKMKQILKSDQCECIAFNNDYYLKLQEEPINIDIPDHLELQRLISLQLGLLK